MEWFQRAADRGQPRALFLLGECYEEGHGVTADLNRAKQYYQKAADKGYKSAQEALQRLEGGVQKSAYTYVPPAEAPKPAPAPQPAPPKGKPKKGGLFGFFKK